MPPPDAPRIRVDRAALWAEGADAGLTLFVEARARPAWRWEFAGGYRLRLVVDGAPRLWARSFAWWAAPEVALANAPPLAPRVQPIRFTEVDAIDAPPRSPRWWNAWAEHFAAALGSSRGTPLHGEMWRLAPVPVVARENARPFGYIPGEPVPPAHSLDRPRRAPAAWVAWWQGEVVPLRELTRDDAGRVKAWRKHARAGTLPPVLVAHASVLGVYVVLDGHARWRAALEGGATPDLLALYPAASRNERNCDGARRAALESAARWLERQPAAARWREPPGWVNEGLIHAFAERESFVPRFRAWPLPGGAAAWDAGLDDLRAALTADAERAQCDAMRRGR